MLPQQYGNDDDDIVNVGDNYLNPKRASNMSLREKDVSS